jgi:mxaK protein|tara:strand:- start:2019 stop:2564 length:546 start_codon:yes stop_codon:yes gene_type:complete
MFIIKKVLNLNSIVFIFILVITIFISLYELNKIKELREITNKIINDELITNDNYEELSLYSSAYLLGKQGEYDNAIEKYNVLLKLYPSTNIIDVIYFNIGTVYLRDALSKPLSDDGKLTIENFQKLQSAIISFEKALAINPLNESAKFNLSILYSSMPKEPSKIISEQAVQELSSIPIGLP